MVRVGGLGYTIDIQQPIGKRISNMVHLGSGEAIDPAKNYVVAGWASVNEGTEGPPIYDLVGKDSGKLSSAQVFQTSSALAGGRMNERQSLMRQLDHIRAEIDRKSGDIRLHRLLEVVEEVDSEATQISLPDAHRRNPDARVGDLLSDPLPPIDFGRIAAQTAKQVIVQKVRDAERERQYEEYKDRITEIVNGIVKRVEYGNVMVDLGRAEAVVRRDEVLPRESFRRGDRVRLEIDRIGVLENPVE